MREESAQTPSIPTSEQEATRASVAEPSPPSLWRSVLQAFRHARLARLEARVRRLQRHVLSAPIATPQPVMSATAERVSHQPDFTWTPVFSTGPRRRSVIVIVGVIGVVTLGGLVLNQLPLQTQAVTVAAETTPSPASPTLVTPPATEARPLTLVTLEERLGVLRQQIEQQEDQLTNQASALASVSQQSDTHQTQLSTVADALAAMSAQVQQVEQQVTTQATRIAAHEKQLARQATQLSQWREPSVGPPVVPVVDHGRAGPPTLELLAPPATTPGPNAASSVPASSAPTVSGASSSGSTPRRTISLPASLGAAGLRATPDTSGGPRP
jgi:hypothetical protein